MFSIGAARTAGRTARNKVERCMMKLDIMIEGNDQKQYTVLDTRNNHKLTVLKMCR